MSQQEINIRSALNYSDLRRKKDRCLAKQLAGNSILLDWQPGSIKPPADGNSRLVVLCEDNDLGFTTAHPVMAEYSFFKNREEWTIYLDGSHHEVTDQVRWWIDLPPIPAD
ncbi:hypothetical protein [Methylomagnum ishizawai]|uniref:hypothetical protein n=1 Tax=Methylomagnum ishizawai TaxID=1760988 RepID=UPI001C33670A|nr:hypothetical protein [Methylomagnum ishizawai]BBL75612.1 hypothetical protein MishRS11D_27100 [Methylomagnum ishizawai]